VIHLNKTNKSNKENSEVVEEQKLKEIAQAVGVTTEALQNFEDVMFNFNSFNDSYLTNSKGAYVGIAEAAHEKRTKTPIFLSR
jgi:hypothetical protein